mmetsp:Transcript_135741/g.378198  ORF Transcript_135741/g.378198 Transcript_135741/m.378198 type:complete len:284 (+) Transcript_135741:146-997(+)
MHPKTVQSLNDGLSAVRGLLRIGVRAPLARVGPCRALQHSRGDRCPGRTKRASRPGQLRGPRARHPPPPPPPHPGPADVTSNRPCVLDKHCKNTPVPCALGGDHMPGLRWLKVCQTKLPTVAAAGSRRGLPTQTPKPAPTGREECSTTSRTLAAGVGGTATAPVGAAGSRRGAAAPALGQCERHGTARQRAEPGVAMPGVAMPGSPGGVAAPSTAAYAAGGGSAKGAMPSTDHSSDTSASWRSMRAVGTLRASMLRPSTQSSAHISGAVYGAPVGSECASVGR